MSEGVKLDDEQAIVEEFWSQLAGGQLRVQRCSSCGYLRWPVGRLCPRCAGVEAEWVAIPSRGTVWSFTTYRHAFDQRFAADLPYTVALVEVVDDVRIIGRLVGDAQQFAIGDEVELVFSDETVEKRRFDWRPARLESPHERG
jgi:uncharacterized OB-fold protein